MTGFDALSSIDWDRWEPTWRATLAFIFRGDCVLLIHKKTGFGKGKINAPGGRLEAGETPLQAAIREVREEVCVTPIGMEACGELRFQFRDGLALHGYVFRAAGCVGTPAATREADPFWQPIDAMPYDHMWADDRHWVPLLFARRRFSGRFLFDGETMLEHAIDVHAP